MEKNDMSIRTPLIVSLVAIAAMLAVTAWGWMVIPANAQIVVHWSIASRPNGYLPKAIGLLVLPCGAMALSAFFALLPKIEPRRANLIASRKLYLTGWYGALGVIGVVHIFMVMNAAGLHVDVPRGVLFTAALFLVVLGNYLGKSRSTFFVGMRLPWTLSSDVAWEKGNRMTGRGFVATGIVTLPALIFVGTIPGVLVFTAGTILSVIAGGVASYVSWRRDPHSGNSIHE
jgi:uncharacterized membrane protein